MPKLSRILVAGAAGYIGSHTSVELLKAGYEVIAVDNYYNSSPVVYERITEITGKVCEVHELDLRDRDGVMELVEGTKPDAVIHFAGLKAVGEGQREPERYYRDNLVITMNLLDAMNAYDCKNMVFSSSATVYGDPEIVPIVEASSLKPDNVYGRTKYFIECMLQDSAAADSAWNCVPLRYFNPVGAHESGLIGEDPNGIPNNLMPYISQVAIGRLEKLQIYGKDYPTPDGTGVRDYIHVVDLALGHLAALRYLEKEPGYTPINLGTGQGSSVLDMLHAMEKAVGREIPHVFAERRPGDVPAYWADPGFAEKTLGWKAELGVDEMCADTWRWQEKNPQGFKG